MLLDRFDALLADLDGVVYAGEEPIDGAADALGRLEEEGVSLGYITNNASRSPTAVADHIRRLGAPASAESVFGSADAAAELLADRLEAGAKVLITGSEYLRSCVEDRGLVPVSDHRERPDAVVQGFDPTLGWADLAEASYAINAGADWVATNTDFTIPRAEGIAPGNGALVNAVAFATGATPAVAGKPEPYLFHHAAGRLGAERPLVVGDRLDTDILGGNRAGFATAAVLTGIDTVRTILAAEPDQRPDYLLATLGDLYRPYPSRDDDGGEAVSCGDERAELDGATLSLSSDSVDAWRAACALWWRLHPEAAAAPEAIRVDGEDPR
ncbi:HAD-IIA family hydrolase [Zhihengliuella sp.]|uniref:HAD-IIA family hydrolase n=1 Tax=Zhihengliuella sp. TaxID=1954483 RepID=UPI0028119CEE|nr:HAD-IIA family hydrolase [Zhihengliuella sp.]